MAGNFTVLSQQSVVQLIGGTQVVDAEQVMIETSPSGIVFPLLFAHGKADAETVAALAANYATQLEAAMADDAVGAIVISQDVNPANQLIDLLEITALSTSGRSSKVITSPALIYDAFVIIGAAQGARAELDAIEAL